MARKSQASLAAALLHFDAAHSFGGESGHGLDAALPPCGLGCGCSNGGEIGLVDFFSLAA
jgi:hypothetical protein